MRRLTVFFPVPVQRSPGLPGVLAGRGQVVQFRAGVPLFLSRQFPRDGRSVNPLNCLCEGVRELDA